MITDIRKAFWINSVIVYAITCILIVAVFANVYLSRQILAESREYIYVLANDGEIIPTQVAETRENRLIEAKHHIQMLVDYFYNFNQYNHENQVNKALWLGDLKAAQNFRMSRKVYDRINQYSLHYRAQLETIDLSAENDNEFNFSCVIRCSITGESGIVPEEYREKLSGRIRTTNRNFPWNPHGLYIEDFTSQRYE